jgi:Pvc16 N-terminal domain
MIHLLDESLETFLRTEVPLPEQDVDIAFEAPDSDWGARITRPTINLYLWDVRPNGEEAQFGATLTTDVSGRPVRRRPLPRVDCRYLVTAWTSDVRDEHSLLGSVLSTLLTTRELGAEHLVGAYRAVRPVPSLRLAYRDAEGSSDVWSALGGQLKPGLDLIVTATVEAVSGWQAGPKVTRYELTIDSVGADGTGGPDTTVLVPDEAGTGLVVLSEPQP